MFTNIYSDTMYLSSENEDTSNNEKNILDISFDCNNFDSIHLCDKVLC